MVHEVTDPDPDVDGSSRTPSFMRRALNNLKSLPVSFKGKSLSEQMKTKNFYAVMLFVLVTITTLWLLMDPSPNFHTIVSETHKQISNIKNIPSNIRHSKAELLEVDHKYLDLLGFTTLSARLMEEKGKDVLKSEPVIVVPVDGGAYEESKRFLLSVKKHVPARLVVFIDIGLGGKESTLLKKTCNSTKNNCEVKQFAFNKYPSHVHSISLRSFVPICIQESLNEYGAIIWSDPKEYFLTKDIVGSLSKARKSGILAWTIKDTTSSITYPKMFSYFDVKPESYFFHRAIKTTHLILFNTDFVRTKIMLPWIKCALVEECVSPTGSQNSGYCIEQRPRYLYSGCHHYEQSALNLILGKVYSYDEKSYTTDDKIFGIEVPNKNTTTAAVKDLEPK